MLFQVHTRKMQKLNLKYLNLSFLLLFFRLQLHILPRLQLHIIQTLHFKICFPFPEVSHSAVVHVSEIYVVPPKIISGKKTRALTISPPDIFKSCIVIIYMYPMHCESSHHATFHLQKTYIITCFEIQRGFFTFMTER